MKTLHRIVGVALMVALQVPTNAQSNSIGSGIAASFPGPEGNIIDIGNVYNDLNFPVTVEAWVHPTAWLAGLYRPVFTTDNVGFGGNYSGFWLRFNSSGKLIFEIGDGSGSGWTDRRGKMTTTSVALNTWTHVVVVANSVTDIKFYFNGVLQPVTNTDGGASNTSILHASYPAYIGGQVTPTTENDFAGMIDEVRLWNIARSETDLREKMCEKLTGTEPGLIGNWRFDENYAGTGVTDYSPSGNDGTFIGSVSKVTSGAPIGDISTWVYTTDYTGVSLNLNSPGGDKLKLTKIGNAPNGVHLYRVNTLPYFEGGLNSNPDYYYGVFTANGATTAKYTATYTYAFTNGVVNAGNELNADLYRRNDNSVMTWVDASALLDTSTNRLIKKNYLGSSEFIFNISIANENGPKSIEDGISDESMSIDISPNPSSSSVTVSGCAPNVPLYLVDLSGKICAIYNPVEAFIEIDITSLMPGGYIVSQLSQNKLLSARFVKQ